MKINWGCNTISRRLVALELPNYVQTTGGPLISITNKFEHSNTYGSRDSGGGALRRGSTYRIYLYNLTLTLTLTLNLTKPLKKHSRILQNTQHKPLKNTQEYYKTLNTNHSKTLKKHSRTLKNTQNQHKPNQKHTKPNQTTQKTLKNTTKHSTQTTQKHSRTQVHSTGHPTNSIKNKFQLSRTTRNGKTRGGAHRCTNTYCRQEVLETRNQVHSTGHPLNSIYTKFQLSR